MLGTNFFGHPANSMTMIGVTGTNGKTSTTWLLKQVLEQTRGAKVGLVGTMENRIGDQVIPTERTTPESIELQELFARMRDAGCTYAVMEVSSHALELNRVAGITFDVAAFTNLTEDHLDFHKTMEAYCDSKAILFRQCRRAVVNGDDPWMERILAGCTAPVYTTTVGGNGSLRAENVEYFVDGIAFTAVYGAEKTQIRVGIPGLFTVRNVLSVLGIALQLGISLEESAAVLAKVEGVKGRIEVVPTPGNDFTVIIDYAHTPDGLENVLLAVKPFCKGRLITVFGCGGERDVMKRPIMGRIAVELADFAIISSDNPRFEDPVAIIKDVVTGVGDAKNYAEEPDRAKAVKLALEMAQKDDIIVLAGKGHEDYQVINDVKEYLNEREIVQEFLAEKRK
jgi:UDP-N-acetylmuramoyl-L-alanyl-D-glutamate--2,6-diaminopimelate ligase